MDTDLLQAVREAGIEAEELARAQLAKKSIARPQKEKEKEAAPKGKLEQKATTAKEKEKAPAVSTGGLGPNKNDKFPEQVSRYMLGGSGKHPRGVRWKVQCMA